ncbi:MAG: class I SAM-dependent methyltransferase, partial [Bacteroidetes bacterium]|nr:class I SAM-dependent methyltransferase [Bacteroidota bacterium]
VNAARRKYTAPNISFETGMAEKIPLPDASVDVVVSFETIEHHDKHTEMMQEIKRVLKPGGTTIISTPDKQAYSDARNYRNPYHLKELYLHEFESLIRDHFQHVIFLYQKYVSGSLIYSPDVKKFDEVTGNYDNLENIREPQGMYIIAVASDEPLSAENIRASLFRGDEMYSQMISEAVSRVQRSASFRLGNFLLAPFRFFK